MVVGHPSPICGLLCVQLAVIQHSCVQASTEVCRPPSSCTVQVTRALSDQVVAWQNAHTEVSRDLVASNLRVAEDAMLIEELKAEHDKLQKQVKKLSLAQTPVSREAQTPSTPGRNSSASGKGGRLSFLGRLTTPRHS